MLAQGRRGSRAAARPARRSDRRSPASRTYAGEHTTRGAAGTSRRSPARPRPRWRCPRCSAARSSGGCWRRSSRCASRALVLEIGTYSGGSGAVDGRRAAARRAARSPASSTRDTAAFAAAPHRQPPASATGIEIRVGPGAGDDRRARRPVRPGLHRRRQDGLPGLPRGGAAQARRQRAGRSPTTRCATAASLRPAATTATARSPPSTTASPATRGSSPSSSTRARRRHADPQGLAALHSARPCSTRSQRSSRPTLADVRGRGTLTEDDVNKAMREIRLALLEADVNFKVVKQFTTTVKERCLGADVIGQLNPGQQVVKIVNEELAALMGGASAGRRRSPAPADGDPDGRPAGLGQDDGHRQARRATCARSTARASPSPPATSTARPPSTSSSRSAARPARRSTSRAPTQPGRHRPLGARPGQAGRQGRPDRRHLRPPARRRGADAGARRHPRGGQAAQRSCSSSTR